MNRPAPQIESRNVAADVLKVNIKFLSLIHMMKCPKMITLTVLPLPDRLNSAWLLHNLESTDGVGLQNEAVMCEGGRVDVILHVAVPIPEQDLKIRHIQDSAFDYTAAPSL